MNLLCSTSTPVPDPVPAPVSTLAAAGDGVAVGAVGAVVGVVGVTEAVRRARSSGPFAGLNGRTDAVADSGRGHLDLKPFWPSRQPHLFDQTCPGSPSASRHSAR
ncbi:hypothetical protein [Streptomyces sp. CB01881]|uniref:hypothetical protein n=1 Tax=Streptomyces sp. CB01881 TaxID=2078691 RepID=UPI000CDBBAE2|nr:hypothetical protein [Streptomyces sp. CB01881]AUY48932.1 hypothetical protein C2142_08165 [Streptomyces sp. CB01881]TYC77421.1 hypothetical protein EH183_08175 [Streptomyces sp. CB01881]